MRARSDLLALALLTGLVAFFFADPLFTGRTFSLHDIEAQGYPFRAFFREMARDGRLYLWNPYTYCGMPFLGDIQNGMLYPPNWLNFVVPTDRVIAWFVVLHFELAGLGTYLWIRGLAPPSDGRGQGAPAALAAAVFYAFSGLMVIRIAHLPIMAAIALLPWLLLLSSRFVARPTLLRALQVGLGLTLVTFTGHPQYAMIAYLSVATYALAGLAAEPRPVADRVRAAGLLALAALFSLLAGAVQLLPALEFLGRTSRIGGLPLQDAAMGSAGWREFVLFLIPDRFGLPLDGDYRGDFYFWEVGFYVGVFPLLLALTGLLLPRGRSRAAATGCLALATLALLLALGRHTPFFGWMHELVPIFRSARIPARFLAMLLPALAFFVGHAVERLGAGGLDPQERRRLAVGLGAATLGFLLAAGLWALPLTHGSEWFLATGTAGLVLLHLEARGRLPSRTFAAGAGALIVLSAFSFGYRYTPTTGPEYYPTLSSLFQVFAGRTPPERVLYFPPEQFLNTVNYPGTARVSNVSGYYPVILRDYAEYLTWANEGTGLTPERESLLHRTTNVVGLDDPTGPMGRLLAITWRYDFVPGRGFAVEALPRSCPRAFLVHRASAIPDPERLLARLRNPAFDPEAEVLLREGPPSAGEGAGAARPGEEARIAAFRPDRVALDLRVEAPGWLVLSEIWDPGWKARVDGAERPVLRADHILRGVAVRPGDRRLELTYEPTTLRLGAALSLLAAGAFLGCLLASRR